MCRVDWRWERLSCRGAAWYSCEGSRAVDKSGIPGNEKKGCSDLNVYCNVGSGQKKRKENHQQKIRNSATGYFSGELKLLRTAPT